ncbi:MAG: hypothetical protein ACR5LG_07050 [Sodalis sp. (in: enterobacteria)]
MKKTTFALLMALISPSVLAAPDDLIIVSGTLHKGPQGETVNVQQLQKQ